MIYAAIAKYTPDASTIAKARPAHRQYLTGLRDALAVIERRIAELKTKRQEVTR